MPATISTKLREIISEVTGNSRQDFASSLREEHKDALLLGRKAYAIDNVNSGITLFMPWRLHGPIESFYKHLSMEGAMTLDQFKHLVTDAELFPKSQSRRKESDIVDYIINKVVVDRSTIDFEEFLHALFLLSKYKASVLRVTEQCAFNHLLTTLIKYGNRFLSDRPSQSKSDVGTPGRTPKDDLHSPLNSKPSSVKTPASSAAGSSRHSSPRALSALGSRTRLPDDALRHDGHRSDTAKSGASSAMNTVKSQLCEPDSTRAEELLKMAEGKMTETCEIMKTELASLREQIEHSNEKGSASKECYKELCALKDSQADLTKQVSVEKEKVNELEKKLEKEVEQSEEARKVMQEIIDELESQITEAKRKQQAADELKTRCQQIQKMLALQPEYESMLFSVFISYRSEELVNGEFVMSEENCIAFCIDFCLDVMHIAAGGAEQPAAKLAFQDVSKLCPEGMLTYHFFKEFLLRLAELMDPQSTQKRAFQLLLMNNIFRQIEDNRNGCQQHYAHAISPDSRGNMPYDNLPEREEGALRMSSNSDNEMLPDAYLNVEGRMWFENQPEDAQPQHQSDSDTPRFPELVN